MLSLNHKPICGTIADYEDITDNYLKGLITYEEYVNQIESRSEELSKKRK